MIRLTENETNTGLGFRFTRCELIRMVLACIGAAGSMRKRCDIPVLPDEEECGPLMTTKEAAAYTGLPVYIIRGHAKESHPEGCGKKLKYYRREALDELMARREERRKR